MSRRNNGKERVKTPKKKVEKTEKTSKELFLQDRVCEFYQIKSKHSELFQNLNQFNDQFIDLSLYKQVPVYFYLKSRQRVFLR